MSSISRTISAVSIIVVFLHLLVVCSVQAQTPPSMMGGGNFTNGEVNEGIKSQIKTLQALGMQRCRVNLYPDAYLLNRNWDQPNPAAMDKIMAELHAAGIKPMMLFEYYAHYFAEKGLGNYEQWKNIGKVYADRYGPGGSWARENNITDGFGIEMYTAFNEPEPTDFRLGGKFGPKPYVEALRGLADGVHSVNAKLKVAPGGFMAANAWKDWSLRGIGPALAPLINDGTLSGIDLHTYYDVQWAPMEGGYASSAQNNFDQVKLASGITRDCDFYSTEFNYKFRKVESPQAASGMVTGLWDHLAVVGNDGKTIKAQFAFPWNLFHTPAEDGEYGMRVSVEPYKPDTRAEVLQRILAMTKGMTVVASDPRGTGMIALRGDGKTLWVWQNRPGWTNMPGTSVTLHGIPKGTKKIVVHSWDGKTRDVAVETDTVTIDSVPGDQTWMFLADAVDSADPESLLPPQAQKRKTLNDMAEAMKKEKLSLSYSVLSQDPLDGDKLEHWVVGRESESEDPDLSAKLIETPNGDGTCAQLTFTFTATNTGVRQLINSSLCQGGIPAPGSDVRLRFRFMGSHPARQIRIHLIDGQGENFVSQGLPVATAWRTVEVPLTGEWHANWGEHSNKIVDWPLARIIIEAAHWGGPSPAPAESIWIDHVQLIEVNKLTEEPLRSE